MNSIGMTIIIIVNVTKKICLTILPTFTIILKRPCHENNDTNEIKRYEKALKHETKYFTKVSGAYLHAALSSGRADNSALFIGLVFGIEYFDIPTKMCKMEKGSLKQFIIFYNYTMSGILFA